MYSREDSDEKKTDLEFAKTFEGYEQFKIGWAVFAEALMNSPEPDADLRRAFERQAELFGKGQ